MHKQLSMKLLRTPEWDKTIELSQHRVVFLEGHVTRNPEVSNHMVSKK